MERTGATLFGKTRRAVLARLFLEPRREFRLRQIARLTGISAGSVQHELKQLVAADIVARSEKHDLVTYHANAACPIYGELRAIVEKTSGIPEIVRTALEPGRDRIRLALIYGSLAAGVNRARSDLDLLVVGSISFGELMTLLQPVEERIGREISPRLYSGNDFRTRLRKRDRFLSSVLQGPTVALLGDVRDAG